MGILRHGQAIGVMGPVRVYVNWCRGRKTVCYKLLNAVVAMVIVSVVLVL